MTFTYQRTYRGPVKLVILDWAGTTMDYGCYAPAVVFVEVYKRNGVEISMEEARQPMGAHKLVHIRQISQVPTVARKWQMVHGRPVTEDDVQKMFHQFVPLQLDCLAQYADLIPGTLEVVAELRKRGVKIGSTTGYTREMMDLLLKEAARRGYVPDATVCATDVPAGRPEPWMCLRNAEKLGVYPMEACIKIGDTIPDVEEGLNAGMWTIGLAKSGNELGMNEREIAALPADRLQARLERAYRRMAAAGAHFVVDTIADVLPVIERIGERIAAGERP
jgi:phosphonoacetaldehyde hydrolase